MNDNDGVLALLTDLKKMLLGLALLVLGGILLLVYLIYENSGWSGLLLLVGVIVAAVGLRQTVSAYNRHEVVPSGKTKEG